MASASKEKEGKEVTTKKKYMRGYMQKRWQKNKAIVFKHYGEKCACCGEADLDVLTIDHKDNNGTAHRKEVKASNLYEWLVSNGLPEGYQTLCRNCNWKKHLVHMGTKDGSV